MTYTIIFATSGLGMILLILAKAWELRRKKPVFLLRIISRSDAYFRNLYHDMLYSYATGKQKSEFLIKKQLPIRSKNFLYKSMAYVKDKRDLYIGNIRDSRLLKKSDGISEFIKSLEIEKGSGKIDETLDNLTQETETR